MLGTRSLRCIPDQNLAMKSSVGSVEDDRLKRQDSKHDSTTRGSSRSTATSRATAPFAAMSTLEEVETLLGLSRREDDHREKQILDLIEANVALKQKVDDAMAEKHAMEELLRGKTDDRKTKKGLMPWSSSTEKKIECLKAEHAKEIAKLERQLVKANLKKQGAEAKEALARETLRNAEPDMTPSEGVSLAFHAAIARGKIQMMESELAETKQRLNDTNDELDETRRELEEMKAQIRTSRVRIN